MLQKNDTIFLIKKRNMFLGYSDTVKTKALSLIGMTDLFAETSLCHDGGERGKHRFVMLPFLSISKYAILDILISHDSKIYPKWTYRMDHVMY